MGRTTAARILTCTHRRKDLPQGEIVTLVSNTLKQLKPFKGKPRNFAVALSVGHGTILATGTVRVDVLGLANPVRVDA